MNDAILTIDIDAQRVVCDTRILSDASHQSKPGLDWRVAFSPISPVFTNIALRWRRNEAIRRSLFRSQTKKAPDKSGLISGLLGGRGIARALGAYLREFSPSITHAEA